MKTYHSISAGSNPNDDDETEESGVKDPGKSGDSKRHGAEVSVSTEDNVGCDDTQHRKRRESGVIVGGEGKRHKSGEVSSQVGSDNPLAVDSDVVSSSNASECPLSETYSNLRKVTPLNWETLPIPLMEHLFRFLKPEDILHCSMVCQAWRDYLVYKSFGLHLRFIDEGSNRFVKRFKDFKLRRVELISLHQCLLLDYASTAKKMVFIDSDVGWLKNLLIKAISHCRSTRPACSQ